MARAPGEGLPGGDAPRPVRQWLWFAALWAGGLCATALLAFLVRAVLRLG